MPHTASSPHPIDRQISPSSTDSRVLLHVDIGHLHPNPNQPRKDLEERQLRELVASIEANGLLQPLLVRRAPPPLPPTGFVIIAGHRRAEAFRRLKQAAPSEAARSQYATIPAWEYPLGLVDDGALLALVENVQRADLSPLEEAQGLTQIQELRPELKTARDLATATGLNEERVRRLLRLHEAPPVVKDGITKGILVPVLSIDGVPEQAESGKAKRQHVRLDLMTALEFTRLHRHFLARMSSKAADERVESAIERALRDRWGKERVVAFVRGAIEGKAPTTKDTAALPAFRSTRKQLVLYRDRLAALAAAERQVLREELQALLTQLSAVGAEEATQPVSTGA